MKQLIASLSIISSRKDSRRVIIISTIVLFLLLLIVENGSETSQVLSFDLLPLFERLSLAFTTFFNISDTFTTSTLILAILGSLLAGINISMAYTYMKSRGDIIIRSGLYSGMGLILAILGIGCVACGTALLSVVLGFFGFSAMLNLLPYQGLEIGYIGIIFLFIATYSLAQKVAAPGVC
ncbi:MAG: hypothetical protein JWN37_599 [Candidatus Nomurabacteria bacterium]|nr:hypothetical protein [Candidatus Nomurabacteria bacterium]